MAEAEYAACPKIFLSARWSRKRLQYEIARFSMEMKRGTGLRLSALQRAAVAGWAIILTCVVSNASVCGISCQFMPCDTRARPAASGQCPAHAGPQPNQPVPSDSDCVRHGNRNSFLQSPKPSIQAAHALGKLPIASAATGNYREVGAREWKLFLSHSPPPSVGDSLYLLFACFRI